MPTTERLTKPALTVRLDIADRPRRRQRPVISRSLRRLPQRHAELSRHRSQRLAIEHRSPGSRPQISRPSLAGQLHRVRPTHDTSVRPA